jgi:hypothetical protein
MLENSQIKVKQGFLNLTIFGIAMGFLEAIVVIYVRQLCYPDGFDFPLKMLPEKMIFIEWIREISTIVMLTMAGIISGRTFLEKFSFFIFTFGIWDIFYYVALKIFINWPSSFLTWDLLFLIPITWLGPVIAPIICSILMISLAIIIVNLSQKNTNFKLNKFEWTFMLAGAFIIFLTFIYDYLKIIFKNGFISKILTLNKDEQFIKIVESYVPVEFCWLAFIAGVCLILLCIFSILRRERKR